MSSLGEKILTVCLASLATLAITAVAGTVAAKSKIEAQLTIQNARLGVVENNVAEILHTIKPETRHAHGNQEEVRTEDDR